MQAVLSRRESRLGAALACLLMLSVNHANAAERIVSANLCADQLLMTLADPSQIVSLSPFAADPAMSYLSEKAKAFPSNRGVGEDIIRLDADLVLVGPFDNHYTQDLLKARHVEFLDLAPWFGLADGRTQILAVAARIGHPERGRRLVEEIDNSLERLRQMSKLLQQRPRTLVYHRRGFVYHAGMTGELAEAAGLKDVSAELGVKGAGFVRLERLLVEQPDFLIVEEQDEEPIDQGQALLSHPALARAFPASKRIVLPARLTICGGPSTIELAAYLADEIAKKVLPLRRFNP